MTVLLAEPLAWLSAGLIMAVGAYVQGAIGFGSALLAAPFLALIDPKIVPGPVLAASSALAIVVAHRDRSALDVRRVGWALTGRFPGVLLGLAALTALSGKHVQLLFGILVLIAVLISAAGPALPLRRSSLLLVGVVSGFMGTVSSIGGPPMALLYQSETGKTLRADLNAYFAVGTLMSLLGLVVIGRFGAAELRWTLVLVVGAVIGAYSSSRGAAFIDAGRTRPAVLLLSSAAALVVIVRAWLGS